MKEYDYIKNRTLGLSRWETLWHEVILGKRDILIENMAQTFAILWMMLPSVELLVRSSGGIGVLLTMEAKYFHMNGVIGIILIIVGIGLIIDYLFGLLKVLIAPYVKYESK
jgi:ABC-type nitrate/sulfonate/bicarbonate transport system permease component